MVGGGVQRAHWGSNPPCQIRSGLTGLVNRIRKADPHSLNMPLQSPVLALIPGGCMGQHTSSIWGWPHKVFLSGKRSVGYLVGPRPLRTGRGPVGWSNCSSNTIYLVILQFTGHSQSMSHNLWGNWEIIFKYNKMWESPRKNIWRTQI